MNRINTLPGIKPLALEDKPGLGSFFKQDNPQVSELTFTNMFMWQAFYQPAWGIFEDCLLIWVHKPNGRIMLLPVMGKGDKRRAMEYGFNLMTEAGVQPCMGRVDQDFIDQWVNLDVYKLEERRNQADYVYLSQDLAALKGNRFHRKKNHLNKFLKSYPDYRYQPLTPDILDQVKAFQEEWCVARECTEGILEEHNAIMLALNNFEALAIDGAAIFVDNQVVAYSLGEQLNRETAVIHIEKANSDIHGAYVAINQMFCQNRWQNYMFINREQDLGLPGLRAAKESYHPHYLLNKYLLTPKD